MAVAPPPPHCGVFPGTRLYDETALELLIRVDTSAHAAPLLPFRGSDEALCGRAPRAGGAGGGRPRAAGASAGHVVEICGPSGSGKTACCLHAACECAMPRELGGHGAGALLVDCDGKLDLPRLAEVLRRKAAERLAGAGAPPGALDAAVRASLARIYVARCWNTLQLLSTTFYMSHSFETMIVRRPRPRPVRGTGARRAGADAPPAPRPADRRTGSNRGCSSWTPSAPSTGPTAACGRAARRRRRGGKRTRRSPRRPATLRSARSARTGRSPRTSRSPPAGTTSSSSRRRPSGATLAPGAPAGAAS